MSRRGDTAAAVGAAALVTAVYFSTLYKSIPGGDSGELVAEACALGGAHPPGYPLTTMLTHAAAKLATALGGRSVAWYANALNASYGAAAAALIALTARAWARRVVDPLSAALAGVAFALSPLTWTYSVGSEVFAMNNMFAAALLYLTAVIAHSSLARARRLAVWGAALCGLALCNQHTVVLFELPLVAFVALRARVWQAPAVLARCVAAGLVGLSPYAYLPASAHLVGHPGAWGDLWSLSGFVRHLRRADYGTFRLFSGRDAHAEPMAARHLAYLKDLYYREMGTVGTALLALGALVVLLPPTWAVSRWGMSASQHPQTASRTDEVGDAKPSPPPPPSGSTLRRRRPPFGATTDSPHSTSRAPQRGSAAVVAEDTSAASGDGDWASDVTAFGRALLLAWAFYLVVFHSLSNLPLSDRLLWEVHSRFWMQANVAAFLLASLPLGLLARALGAAAAGGHGPDARDGTPVAGCRVWATRLALPAAVAFGLGARTLANYPLQDMSANDFMARYASALLQPLPANATLLLNYDMAWTAVRYKQECERERPDVISINLSMMSYRWFAEHVRHGLYPTLAFPGSTPHLVHAQTGGFSFLEFLDANVAPAQAGERHGAGGIFLVGHLPNPTDKTWRDKYQTVAFGLSDEILPLQGPHASAAAYARESRAAWAEVHRQLPALPDESVFDSRWWEWTVGREWWRKTAARAAIILDLAQQTAPEPDSELEHVALVAESTVALERALANEAEARWEPSWLKNLGLAHVTLVRHPSKPRLAARGIVPGALVPPQAAGLHLPANGVEPDGARDLRSVTCVSRRSE